MNIELNQESSFLHIALSEHSEITDPVHEMRCREIQDAIRSKKLLVTDLTPMLDGKKGNDTPTLFGRYQNHYYTQKYVGVVSYENTLVTIGSRFDTNKNNSFFLQYMFEQITNLKLFHHPNKAGGTSNTKPFLVLMFFQFVEQAYGIGAYREYRRLNPQNNGKIAYQTREYTVDNHLNLLVLTANCKLSNHDDERLKEYYQNCLERFPKVKEILSYLQRELPSPSLKQQEVMILLRNTSRPITHPFYQKFEPLRVLSHRILNQDSIDFFQDGESLGQGAVFSMDRAWEVLLERKVFQGFTKKDRTYTILEGGRNCEPDLLAVNEKDELSVFDAKNKPRWASQWVKEFGEKPQPYETWDSALRGDVYQILSYLYICKAQRCGVVFPIKEKGQLHYAKYNRNILSGLADFYFVPVSIPSSQETSYESYQAAMDQTLAQCQQQLRHLCGVEE